MSDHQATGTSDPTYLDDEGTDAELRQYFQQVQQGYRRAADMGKNLLVQRIEHEH